MKQPRAIEQIGESHIPPRTYGFSRGVFGDVSRQDAFREWKINQSRNPEAHRLTDQINRIN
ncbi:hypothetical protein [Burkholderia metallica]|uniref:hypothetical protein n=1 Tax=Burkholderia metallica TaxID=488729 RepID=UPI001CF1E941|nr:hypothetical protein [Burkholderia metallica]MCA8022652.1 hypothetical protein [Burkholderia metallica]